MDVHESPLLRIGLTTGGVLILTGGALAATLAFMRPPLTWSYDDLAQQLRQRAASFPDTRVAVVDAPDGARWGDVFAVRAGLVADGLVDETVAWTAEQLAHR